MKTASNQLLVIFGASGDLTGRKLLPSLYELHVRRLLPERFCILGAARTEYSDDEYRAFEKVHIRESLKKKEVDEAELDSFLRRVFYLAFDSTNSAEYHKLKDRIHQLQQEQQLPDKIIYYLATPPVMYELIPTCLKENGMNVAGSEDGWRRVIVEKPFGTSLESAERLNKHLIHIFDEKEIYRIDHYLGKETVQNILVLRFSNVYGERQGDGGEGGVISIFAKRLAKGQDITIFGNGKQTRDFVYAGDIARGIRLALTTPNADTCYNLSTQTEISLNELVTILSRITGKEITPSYGPAREGDIYRSSLSNEKAVKNLHWIPEVSLEEGLRRTYQYFQKQ